jgi:hypothetical protein
MVSYFNLMIATDLCFAITPVGDHDLMALGSPACCWPPRHSDDRYRAVDPSLPGGRIISA